MRQGLVGLLVLVSLWQASPSLAADPPRAELPTYQVGRKWFRNDGAYELVTADAEGYLFRGTGYRQNIRLTRSLGIIQIQSGPYNHTFTPPLTFDWPLQVGNKGELRAMLGQTPTIFSWVVIGYGDLRVGAITLKAFEIRITVTHPSSQKGGRIQLWYAPDRGEFVKLSAYHDGAAGGVSGGLFVSPDDVSLSQLAFEIAGTSQGANQEARTPDPRQSAPPAGTAPAVPSAVRPSTGSGLPVSAMNIAIALPQDLARVTEEVMPLAGVVTGQDIAEVIVALNGVELTRLSDSKSRSVVPLNLPLKLAPGRNLLVVTAVSATGAVQQDIRSVFRERGNVLAITYRVKATSNLIRVTFRTPDGRTERRELRLPLDVDWSVTFDTAEGSQLEIAAELADDYPGAVACEILVNGSVVSADKREGRRLGTRCSVQAPGR
jgi:hypothetical protein